MNGYDFEPKENSPYLRLKSKGDKVKVRFVSAPIHFEEEDVKGKMADRFAWVVIDRADGEVKAYKAGVMVYKDVKKYATDEDWGDPTGYDFTIERTEEQGRYYAVTPSPAKKPITEEEKKQVELVGIDLEKLFKTTDQGTKTFGSKEEAENSQVDNEVDISEIPF